MKLHSSIQLMAQRRFCYVVFNSNKFNTTDGQALKWCFANFQISVFQTSRNEAAQQSTLGAEVILLRGIQFTQVQHY
jgi:hypothetical protein